MIRLDVIGVPAPQGSKTRMPNGAMVDGSSKTGRAKLVEWRRAVADAARAHLREHPGDRLTGPVRLGIRFVFPVVASDPYRYWHATKPDIDKVLRATLDALTASTLFTDDARVADVEMRKVYGARPGARIEIENLAPHEFRNREVLKMAAANQRRAAKRANVGATRTGGPNGRR